MEEEEIETLKCLNDLSVSDELNVITFYFYTGN